jgi:gamma-glutamylcyclotransferase (GGCT)/AIG2-like uncharacterized protein YtfP
VTRTALMSELAPSYLFVYGTLLPGRAPAVIAEVVDRLRVVGPGTVAGRLYDLGPYPACALDGDCGRLIHGVVLEIPDAGVLARLDWYEGYAAHDEAGASLFLRTTCDVTLDNGRSVPAWVYVYNRDLSRARLIEGGRYDRG